MFWKKPKTVDTPPEWLIVGLGNPGAEYSGTRHNVGFDVVEFLAAKHKIRLDKSKHRARIGVGQIGSVPVCLVKPLTYMNLSGQSVAPLARGYGIKPDHVLIIADDLALPRGKLRLREDGSAGGHNGHKSIIQSLGTQTYPRVKVGIGSATDATIEHVLSRFKPEEKKVIQEAIEDSADAIETLLQEGHTASLHRIEHHNKNL